MRFEAQRRVDASVENEEPLPDDFVMPEDVRLDPGLMLLRLYAADAVSNDEVRAEALQDAAVEIRDTLAEILDPEFASQADEGAIARTAFTLKYDIFRAYAMFGEDPGLVELAADDLRQYVEEDSEVGRDIDAWVALRTGDPERALEYFRSAPSQEVTSQIGLALTHVALGRPGDAIGAFRRVHALAPLGAQGAWARSRAEAIMPPESAAFFPWAERMERFAASTPRWVEEMVYETGSFMSLNLEPASVSESALDPAPLRITVRNLAPVPLGVGPDRPINSSFMLSPRTEIELEAQTSLVQPEIVEGTRRLRLLPRESMTIEVDPTLGFTGWVIETNSYRTIRTRWRALQGFMYGDRGYFVPGPNCLSTTSDAQLGTLNGEVIRPIAELIERVRTAPVDELRAVTVAARTRLLIGDASEPALTAEQRAEIATACADRFSESDTLVKLLMLSSLPHAGQAPEMQELDELARKDLDPRVLAVTMLTRMPRVDTALLERARSLDEPWLSEIAGILERRVLSGGKGIAHATPSISSLGGYLRGSGSLDSPEFDRPEPEAPEEEGGER